MQLFAKDGLVWLIVSTIECGGQLLTRARPTEMHGCGCSVSEPKIKTSERKGHQRFRTNKILIKCLKIESQEVRRSM